MLPCQQETTFTMIIKSLDNIEKRFDKQDIKLECMDEKMNRLSTNWVRAIGFSAGSVFVVSLLFTIYTAWAGHK